MRIQLAASKEEYQSGGENSAWEKSTNGHYYAYAAFVAKIE
jgi:hypothetical protein